MQIKAYGPERLQNFVKYTLFERPKISFDYKDAEPIFDKLQAGDRVFSLISFTKAEFRSLSGAHSFNAVAAEGYVSGYVDRSKGSRLSDTLNTRQNAADAARLLADQNIPPFAELEALSRTLINRGRRYHVLCKSDLDLSSSARLTLVMKTTDLSLYEWNIAGE
ncbi:MAG: hypothetical protein HKN85_01715 [Gammaproteobacteria bacterium]|nr:hypothetical protein [Gammaproteobacteria bacterium]